MTERINKKEKRERYEGIKKLMLGEERELLSSFMV